MSDSHDPESTGEDLTNLESPGHGSAERYTPEDQAVAVWGSHVTIALVVSVIMLAGFGRWPPGWFLGAETGIFLMFFTLVPSWPTVTGFVARFVRPATSRADLDQWEASYKEYGRKVAFGLTFVLQYVALTSLLKATGGPINSPFAQLAVAFAVFTPILANRGWTIGIALVGSLSYYGYMIWQYGFDGPHRPAPGVFYAVTSLILILTVVLTVLDKRDAARPSSDRSGDSGVS